MLYYLFINLSFWYKSFHQLFAKLQQGSEHFTATLVALHLCWRHNFTCVNAT